jgi:hypothetical protein
LIKSKDSLKTDLNASNETIASLISELKTASSTISSLNEETKHLASENLSLSLNLKGANLSLSSLNTLLNATNSNYQVMAASLNSRLGDGEDAKVFVTPDDADIVKLVGSIASPFQEGDWTKASRDYVKLFDWVIDNISYSSDSPYPVLPPDLNAKLPVFWSGECWRYPRETILQKTGDCEDQAVLLTSMLRCYFGCKYDVYAIEINNGLMGHVAVCMPISGGYLAIFDPTGGFYTNTSGAFTAKPAQVALNEWLDHWSAELPGSFVGFIFNEKVYQEFHSNIGFLSWVELD